MSQAEAVITMRKIVKTYYIGQPNELEILHGMDLDIYKGEFVSIVGESGSGKSTLMNIIGALDQPTSGSYVLNGTDMIHVKDKEASHIRNQEIGFVFQTYNLIGRMNALKNVELPMLYAGMDSKARTQRAMELLKLVGMEDRMKHMPNELHQKQGVTIVLITHNMRLAEESERIIQIADGRIIGEKKGNGAYESA